MLDFGIKISKEGKDVNTATAKDLSFSSQYDTLKVLRTGTLTISLPSETINNNVKTYTATYTHNLGYIPFFLPLARNVLNQNTVGSTTAWNINDTNDVAIPAGGFSPSTEGEYARLYATSTTLVLEVKRYNSIPINVAFGAKTANVYYTLFHNRVDETVDLS